MFRFFNYYSARLAVLIYDVISRQPKSFDVLRLICEPHFPIELESGHVLFQYFCRPNLYLLQALIALFERLARKHPGILDLVSKQIESAAENDRIIFVIGLQNIESAPEWHAFAEFDLQAALIWAVEELRKTECFLQIRPIFDVINITARLRVEHANQAVLTQ